MSDKCKNCGFEIEHSDAYCSNCGVKTDNKMSLFDRIKNRLGLNNSSKKSYENFIKIKSEILKLNQEITSKEYFDKNYRLNFKKDNKKNYKLCCDVIGYSNSGSLKLDSGEITLINVFINNYASIDLIANKRNELYIKNYHNQFKQSKGIYQRFVDRFSLDNHNDIITENKTDYKYGYDLAKKLVAYEKTDNYSLGDDSELIHDFIMIYDDFENIKNKINSEIERRNEILESYSKSRQKISIFIDTYLNPSDELIIKDYKESLRDFEKEYEICLDMMTLTEEYHNSDTLEFIELYDNFEEISQKINENYISKKYESFNHMKAKIKQAIVKYQNMSIDDYLHDKANFLNEFGDIDKTIKELRDFNYDLNRSEIALIDDFSKLNDEFRGKFATDYYNRFINNSQYSQLVNELNQGLDNEKYIFDKNAIIDKYKTLHNEILNLFKLNSTNEINLSQHDSDNFKEFLNNFDRFDLIVDEHNEKYALKIDGCFQYYLPRIVEFNEKFNGGKLSDRYISDKIKSNLLKSNEKIYNLLLEFNEIPILSNDASKEFIYIYENFDDMTFKLNKNYIKNLYRKNKLTIKSFIEIINLKQNYYISNSKVKQLFEEFKKHSIEILNLINYGSDHNYLIEDNLEKFPSSFDDLKNTVPAANEAYIQRELVNNKEFFDNIVSGKSLDIKQRKAVLIDEDNTQIIAGAGCGKTLTLQAKAKYLTEKQNINPGEILAISYSKKSADDLKSKMDEIGVDIDVKTFHSLGLNVLRQNKIKSNTDEHALKNAIKEYFLVNILDNPEIVQKIIEYFGYYIYEPLNKDSIDNIGEVYDYERGMDLETLYSKFDKLRDPTLKKTSLKGEKVKSLEERKIANFLFINGIKYTYEKEYEPKFDWKSTYEYLNENLLGDFELPYKIKNQLSRQILKYLEIDETIRWSNTGEEVVNYHPDFYLDDYDIYYEHFGVNRNCLAPWLSPYQSRKYKNSMKSKRVLHKKYGTQLIETYSYYQSENRLLKRLEEKLIENGVELNKINYQQFMVDLLKSEEKINEYYDFRNLVSTFINLFKGNGYGKEKFDEFRKINEEKYDNREKHKLFLDIVEDIYDYYYEYLKKHNLIDFNDMINDAIVEVEKNGFYKKYKYIMVDEFQDTSHTRFNLLKAIKNDLNAKVIVVGDDWQSIYQFTGCDIDLFTNFKNYFNDSKTEICYITNTYRNSQSLIDVSGEFIMKNNSQFKKHLNSKSETQITDSIKLYQYLNPSEQPRVFEAIINDIYKSSDEKIVNILVLGRNRRDYLQIIDDEIFYTTGSVEDKNLKIHYPKNTNISIDYMTVHGSKGLEEKNVVLINLKDTKKGFPNKIEDDSVLSFVKNDNPEEIDFAEERRLFYVALTRTLGRTYLLAPKSNKSVFVDEIIDKIDEVQFELPEQSEEIGDGKIRIIASTDENCPHCKTGNINLKFNPKTGKKFFKCSNWPICEWYGGNYYGDIEALDNPKHCPRCGGLIVKKLNSKGNYFYGCINYCPDKECRYSKNIIGE